MREFDSNTVLKRTELPGNFIDDELVLFNHKSGKYFGTGPVGAEIWRFLAEPRSFDEVCNHLLQLFDVDQTTCKTQVTSYMSDLMDNGIVTITD